MSEIQDLPDVLAGSTDRLKNMGETGTGMPGVMPASMSRSLNINTQENGLELAMEMNPKMTSSMTMAGSNNSLNKQPRRNYTHRNATSQNWFTFEEEPSTGRVDLATKEKEREDKIRKMRELQEEQRKKKLEELKQHALHAQKFREQQEVERRRHIEELRSRDMDRRAQVEERRREIERAEFDRREAILAKNRERAERIESQRRNSRGQLELAFGSSAPRLMEGHRDSSSWATRSTYDRRSSERELDLKSKRTTSAQGLDRNTEGDDTSPLSLAASQPTAHRRRTDLIPTGGFGGSGMLYQRVNSRGVSGANTPGRAASASRLDILAQPKCLLSGTSMLSSVVASSKSMITLANINNPATKTAGAGHNHNNNNNNRMTASLHAAFKTTLSSRPSAATAATLGATFSVRRQRAMTSGHALNNKSAGLSRENSVTTSRPSSAMSGGGQRHQPATQAQVRLRPSTAGRRPRPLSIATTGMTSSMYEERQKPFLRNKSSATPKLDRSKRARSINGEQIDDDQRSNGSSTGCGPVGSAPVRPSSARKTPAQVKAENAARRAKMSSRPKLDANNSGHNSKEILDSTADLRSADSRDKMAEDFNGGEDGISGGGERQITPDIIKGQDSSKSESSEKEDDREAEVANNAPTATLTDAGPGGDKESSVEKEEKRKIITSEEEAKARIAEKRKEMKEKMEREAEIERLRLEAEAAAEEEQRRAEEEEERRMIEETERLAAEARRQEEERIHKAMEEEAERVRLEKEEEERMNKEKEEAEKKAKEEAEKREKELIELEEKRRVEEEERLRRKARVEAIMARTRGKGGTPTGTPKKEADKNEDSISQNSQPPSLDTNVDPTKPDLLGDITEPQAELVSLHSQINNSDNNDTAVAEEMAVDNPPTTIEVDGSNTTDLVATDDKHILDLNNTNSSSNDHVIENGVSVTTVENGDSAIATTKEAMNGGGFEEGLEKGALDSLSNKSEDSSETESHQISSNHSQLIEVDNGKISALENDFDQILDLSADRTVTDVSGAPPQPPIIAFEANSQPQADLLS